MSQRPHRCRTWSRRGVTPVLQYHFNWKSLSAVAGLTMWNFYFRIYAGSVKSPQVVEFLEALARHIRGPLLLVWDGLPAHRLGGHPKPAIGGHLKGSSALLVEGNERILHKTDFR